MKHYTITHYGQHFGVRFEHEVGDIVQLISPLLKAVEIPEREQAYNLVEIAPAGSLVKIVSIEDCSPFKMYKVETKNGLVGYRFEDQIKTVFNDD